MKKTGTFGFTLIELLAVIIILGILMFIAIPSVTEYINNSRKEAYIKTIEVYVEAAKVKALSFNYDQMPQVGEALIIPFNNINLERKISKSPYGEFDFDRSYILLVNDGSRYTYYVNAMDDSGYKISNVKSSDMNRNSITSAHTLPDPIKISDILTGSKVAIYGGKAEVSPNHNASFDEVLLSIEYEPYSNGQTVKLVDNSEWYVIEDLGNSVRLLSKRSIDINGNLVINGNGYKTKFNGNTNTGKYDPSIMGSVGYILNNVFKPKIESSISDYDGYPYDLKVSILSADDVVRLAHVENYYDPSLHEVVEPNTSIDKGEYLHNLKVLSPLTETDSNALNYLLNYAGFWTSTVCSHTEGWAAGNAIRVEYNCLASSSEVDEMEIRPVITILKVNILE